ncbi:T9SS type A sorting domain-containing protein [uncultured Marivirga sp.]|uniref:T9SS type A sorting domain-containing protein n=1 Tax=uncultured Marivirga sp. TaxID=1123707 RepID=UPI0030EB7A6D
MKRFLHILILFLVTCFQVNAQVTGTTISNAANIDTDEATLNGDIQTSAAVDVNYQFNYGTTSGSLNLSSTLIENFNVDGTASVGATLPGLSPETQYFYELYAEKSSDDTENETSSEGSFYTLSEVFPNAIADFTTDNITNDEIQLDWTASSSTNTDGYIILYATGATAPDPDGILELGVLPGNQTFANKIVINNDGTESTTLSSLAAATQYSFSIIPFNNDGANTEETTNYNLLVYSSVSSYTLATEPDANPTGLTYESKLDESVTISLTEEPTADGYLILYRTGTNGPNKNGVTDGIKHADAADFDQATGFYYSDGGANTLIEIPGLSPATTYSFNVLSYAYGTDGLGFEVPETYNYVTSDNKINEITTTSEIPSAEVNNFVKTSSTTTGMTFSFDQYTGFADDGGTVVYFEIGNSVDLSTLENGFQPIDQPTIGTDYQVQNTDNATSITVQDGKLSPGTKYSFRIVPFNFNGTDFPTMGYYTTNAPIVTHYTLSAPASGGDVNGGNFIVNNETLSSVDLTWDAVTGADGYLVVYEQGNSAIDLTNLEDGLAPGDLSSPGFDFEDVGSILSTTVSSLSSATEYAFHVIPYTYVEETGSPVSETYNYNTAAPPLKTASTLCDPPAGTATFNVPTNKTSSSIDLSWSAVTGADKYLVVAKQGAGVDLTVENGDDFEAEASTSFTTAGAPDSDGNKIIYSGNGLALMVTDLSNETEYTFAIYAYKNGTFCYAFGPDTETITTDPADQSNTLTLIGASSTISSVANDASGSFITVMDFDMNDLGGDNETTNLSSFTFSAGANDEFESLPTFWDNIIEEAKVVNTNNGEELSASISTIDNEISVSIANNNNNNAGQFGFIADGGSINIELQIRLKESITAADIDGKNFVFSLDPATISTEGNSSQFATGGGTSIKTADSDNEIEVIATDFDFATNPPSTVDAGENVSPQAVVEVTDANGNLDLDYSTNFTITNDDGINMQNLPSTFNNGEMQFPVNFNYQGSGDGTLTITDDTDSFFETSNAVSVNPTIELAELTAGLNGGTLQSGTSEQAILGFSVEALGNTQLQEIEFTTNIDLTNVIGNIQITGSANNTFDGTGTDAVIASSPIVDNGNNTVTFTGLTQNFSSETKYFFLIVDVDESVNEFDNADLTVKLNITDLNFGNTVNKLAGDFAQTYSFEDITKPLANQVAATPTLLSGKDLGNDALEIEITFNEEMDPSAIPTVSFPVEDPTNSLSAPNGNSAWSAGNTVYTLFYDLTDQDELVENIDVLIKDAADKSGNILTDFTENDLFTIDTENPEASSINLDRALINRPNNTIELQITFNKQMNGAIDPTIVVNGTSNMSDNSDGSWSGGNLIYTITFNHDLTEEALNNINFDITDAEDVAGNLMDPATSGNFNINTKRPRIDFISTSSSNGLYGPGDNINIQLIFDEDITVNGTPSLDLNTGGEATFQNFTDNIVNFTYTVGAVNSGESTSDLDVDQFNMNGGEIKNLAGNDAEIVLPSNPDRLQDNAAIQVDTEPANINNVTSTDADGFYKEGDIINITIEFDEDVLVSGSPQLELNSGDLAVYQSGSASSTLTFNYTVQAADGGTLFDVSDLNYVNTNSLILNGGSITDQAGINADLDLPSTGGANSIGGNKDITIDTQAPELETDPFNPESEKLNASQQMIFTIELDEIVSGSGTGNIRIVEMETGNVLETLDGATAFTNNTNTTLNFISLESILNDTTEYYFEFDAGAIVDQAGNEFAGFTANNIWSFTTFGPARIDDFSIGACVGELFSIQGKYFTGVSRIRTNINGSSPFTISTFTIIDDENIEFIVPAGTEPGTLTLDKQNGQAGNTDDASTTSQDNIKVGPSSAQFVLVNIGTGVVCDDPEGGSPIETAVRVDVIGGSGTYTLEYDNGTEIITVTGYTSGQVLNVNPPQAGINTYEIVSLTDEDDDLNSCSAPNLGTSLDVEEYTRSTVEAGGVFDSEFGGGLIEICLATTNEIDFSDASLVGVLPSINGNVTTGTWTIDQGPSQNGGGFSPNGSVKSTTNIQPIYYPSLADASEGEIVLRLISDDPAAPNPCVPDEDVVLIRFVSTISVRLGDDLSVCKVPVNETTDIATAQLNAALGGGADGIEWTRVDQYSEAGSHDGSWGFADNENDISFSLTSTNPQAIYKASPMEVEDGGAILEAIPTASGGGCGGTPDPRQLEIIINDLPTPSKSFGDEIVCSGEEAVRYRMTASSSQSTFIWSLTNTGLDSEGLNDKNEIDGLQTGNLLIVNFREVFEETQDTLIVNEISTLTGCVSLADTFLITIKPQPIAEILYNSTTTLSNSADLILLQGQGGQSGSVEIGGEFFGPGVIRNSNGDYFLDTSQLDVTDITDEENVHEVIYVFSDEFGCSASSSIAFNVFDAETIFPNLSAQYCELDATDTISVDNAIIPEGFLVSDISGPGITIIGFEELIIRNDTLEILRAEFNPKTALEQNEGSTDPSSILIKYSISDPENPANNVENIGEQIVIVNPLPELFYTEPEYDFCTYDEPVELEPETGNPGLNYSFEIVNEGIPEAILTGSSETGYEFDPSPMLSYLNAVNRDSVVVQIRYTYQDANTCQNSEIFDFLVWRQPAQPTVNSVDLCFVNNVMDTASVTNYFGNNPNQELFWYASQDFSLDPIGEGLTFVPDVNFFATSTERVFYVVRRNVDSAGEDDDLCESESTAVTYRRVNNPNFSWNSSVYEADGIIFTGTPNATEIDTLEWKLKEWQENGFVSVTNNVFSLMNDSTTSVDFRSLGAGRYQMTFQIYTINSCTAEITKEFLVLPKVATASQYAFDFEKGNSEWISYSPTGPANDWDLAVPTENSNIKSGNTVWITNKDGSYNSGALSYVYSPSFDLSSVSKPVISFDLWLDMVEEDDGLILEYSTDNKVIEDPTKKWQLLGDFEGNQSSGLNWYNLDQIQSFPGTGIGTENNNPSYVGWSSEFSAEGEVAVNNAVHALEVIPLQERNNVMFRFQFKSRPNENEQSTSNDGVAFDNLRIESLNRNVLIEYFGDDASTADAVEMNSIQSAYEQSRDFAWINYRINENDTLYTQFASAMLSRTYYYDAYEDGGGISIDGNLNREINFSGSGEIELDQARLVASLASMRIDATAEQERLLINVDYELTESASLSENTRLFVAVIQKEVSDGDQGTNESKTYYHVLRKILPNNGGLILEDFTSGAKSFEFIAQYPSDENPLAIVAFMQDIETGQIIQSAQTDDFEALSLGNITSKNRALKDMEIQLYPNPAKSHLNMSWSRLINSDLNVKVMDLTGKIIEEIKFVQGSYNYELSTQKLKTGMYNLLITNDKGEHKVMKFAVTN